jgi:PAS domain-containing protein
MYLVVFADQGPGLSREEAIARAQLPRDGTVAEAEKELRDTRERLQSMIEEYETALEELKSSNEELVSVNEELQSSNEELEASKEELVSLNEELHTVNLELNGKIEALDRANTDLQNLFESTSVATVFLDRDLVIRSFTPAMNGIFHIRPTDRGRPITELASRLDLPGLEKDIATVFRTNAPRERHVSSNDGLTHFLIRLRRTATATAQRTASWWRSSTSREWSMLKKGRVSSLPSCSIAPAICWLSSSRSHSRRFRPLPRSKRSSAVSRRSDVCRDLSAKRTAISSI